MNNKNINCNEKENVLTCSKTQCGRGQSAFSVVDKVSLSASFGWLFSPDQRLEKHFSSLTPEIPACSAHRRQHYLLRKEFFLNKTE